MAEIYRDSVDKAVALGIPDAVVSKVDFIRDGLVVATNTTGQIPYSITQQDGRFAVLWTYSVPGDGGTYTRTEEHSVVTPLFNKADLVRKDSTMSTLTDEQVIDLESLIRKVVEAYTGQSFGYRKGQITVWGSGDSVVNSPERVLSLSGGWAGYRPVNDGYGVERISNYASGTTVVVRNGEAIGVNLEPIYGNNTSFRNNVGYVLTGEFGWYSVPEDVKTAALILAEEFSCDESVWRDRYIKSVRAADWRFDFTAGSHIGTGSLTADQLLAKYVVNRMVVI